MMHKISMHLPEYNCSFTPFYANGLLDFLSRKGFTDFTILGGKHRQYTEKYLKENKLPVDYKGMERESLELIMNYFFNNLNQQRHHY